MSTDQDQRMHLRTEFFLVPLAREQIPVWVFKPESLADGHAGLILNMSQGGLQVLTKAELPLTSVLYDIDLLLGEGRGVAPFKGQARLVWSRPATQLGDLNGLEFLDRHSQAEEFLMAHGVSVAERKWVRCLLVPRSA